MNLGIDVHGVIDRYPDIFSNMSNTIVANGGQVHIITGSSETDDIKDHLRDIGIIWTDFFSISDQLIYEGHQPDYDKDGNIWFDNELWDPMKGHYCNMFEIDLHFDDTSRYSQYFSTPFVLWPSGPKSWT